MTSMFVLSSDLVRFCDAKAAWISEDSVSNISIAQDSNIPMDVLSNGLLQRTD